MTTYSVKCYENQNTRDCFMFGYAEGDPLTLVTTLTIEAPDETAAAEIAFAVGNGQAEGRDLNYLGYWPYQLDFRSMSKGDVVEVSTPDSTPVRLACASCGWVVL